MTKMERKSALTKSEFIKLLEERDDQENRIDTLSSIGIDVFDSPLIEYGNLMFERLIETHFTSEGSDWIYWWLYDKNGDPEMKAWDENHNEIPLETIEDLWSLVEQYLK